MPTRDRSDAEWVEDLCSAGPAQNSALEDLRRILHRGLERAFSGRMQVRGREFEILAADFIQETLLLVLRHLETFQGRSRFTTWAYKIAIRTVFSELRRRRWKDVSLEDVLENKNPSVEIKSGEAGPEELAERSADMEWVRRAMEEELTEKQRTALRAIAIGGMPLEVAAERLQTNRNALYKLLHDARKRLKKRRIRDGFPTEGTR
jgi:RNA polymerase sigma-70 factor (ECF subfamily)